MPSRRHHRAWFGNFAGASGASQAPAEDGSDGASAPTCSGAPATMRMIGATRDARSTPAPPGCSRRARAWSERSDRGRLSGYAVDGGSRPDHVRSNEREAVVAELPTQLCQPRANLRRRLGRPDNIERPAVAAEVEGDVAVVGTNVAEQRLGRREIRMRRQAQARGVARR